MNKLPESINKVIQKIIPPEKWKSAVVIFLGIIAGLILYIFFISRAYSYLSDDPSACVNCHIMSPQFATWQNGSHGRVTTCNDCHVPHDNFIRKYYFKASDGIRHATMFTFRLEPQVIRIHEAGRNVVQENCIRCHQNYLHPVSLRAINAKGIYEDTELVCWDCHRETPHGKVNSLSSAPYARVPVVTPVIPEWMNNYFSKQKKEYKDEK